MSDVGGPPPPERSGPAPDQGSPEMSVWVIVVAVVLLLVTAGGAAYAWTQTRPVGTEQTYPATWDPRIKHYVAVTEKLRGLDFVHPVAVRFLPPRAFEKTVTGDEKSMTRKQREEVEHLASQMRALGLLPGGEDLLRDSGDDSPSGVLAYYSFETRSITVRGTRVTPAMRSTLVHELTHVLQDQHFGVGDQMIRLIETKSSGYADNETSAALLRGVVEGDAVRVEGLYKQSLSPRKRKVLVASQNHDARSLIKQMHGSVPKVVTTLVSAPYTLGEGMMAAVSSSHDTSIIDDLLRAPPVHETALLDPLRAVDHDRAVRVQRPGVGPGEKKYDEGEIGALKWYLMLAEQMPIADALAVTDGWGGDSYVGYSRQGRDCMRVQYQGVRRRDTDHMERALRHWVKVAPGSSAAVTRSGHGLRFTSCDPGKTLKLSKDASIDALRLVATRTSIGVSLVRAGLTTEVSACLSQRLVQEFPLARLGDRRFVQEPSVLARIRTLATGCRRAAA